MCLEYMYAYLLQFKISSKLYYKYNTTATGNSDQVHNISYNKIYLYVHIHT